MGMKTALITGATSGIGKACATKLAGEGYRLILTGRRVELLNELVSELKQKTDVLPLVFDVRERKVVESLFTSLSAEWKNIDVLINNAGNAHGLSPIGTGDIDDWDAMIDINVKGLLYVSRAVIPGMMERKSGHIINIGSIAAKETYAQGNVYCASKHAVDALSKSMRLDLTEHNIKVAAVHPGLVDTEFSTVRFKGDKEKANAVYKNMHPLYAEDIAEIIAFMISRPWHVNIADLLVLPTAQASATLINRTQN
jgi:NADP-dependent 3-hydroxy acid dehydrogenase YdfG